MSNIALPGNASRGKKVLRTSKKMSMTATDHINQQAVASYVREAIWPGNKMLPKSWSKWRYDKRSWCGARLRGSISNAINLILRLYLYHFLHMMSLWCHKSIHNNTNNQQTPPPWWWSRSPLQRRGFEESTPSEWWAALRIHFLRLLLKGLVKFNKLM